MAFSSLLSFALIQVVLYSTVTATTTAKIISIPFSKAPAANSTDNYLLPVSIGANSQQIYLTPCTSTDDTFINSARTCTPPGNNTAMARCVQYRGGVFVPPLSKTTNSVFTWKNEYGLFADGSTGEDSLTFPARGGNVVVDAFGLGLVDVCNVTSALLGLGRNSTLLARLVRDGRIGSRAYGLFVGVDGMGVGVDDGVGRGVGRRDGGLNATVVRSFPGSLTLGGYDEARIDGTAKLEAPIVSDGSLRLEATSMVLHNDAVHGVLNNTREVVIDSSTPYLYLPESTAQQLSYALEAQGGEPGVDFFYGNSADGYIGNVTFTLRVPGGGSSIDVVLPPSVLYQPVTELRNYVPVGNVNYNHYLPIKTFADSSDQPIVLGRTFLKAAYLFVNHDENVFQLSQVAYNLLSPNLIAATAVGASGFATPTPPPPTAPPSGTPSRHPLGAPIAAAVGGGVVVLAFAAIAFLLWRRRQSQSQSTLKPIPSTVTVAHYGNELDSSSTPMVDLPSRDEKHPGGPGAQDWGVWEKDGDGGFYTPHPLQGGVHEMESDYVGMATSPSQAYPPKWVELPAEPVPVHMRHSVLGERHEMM